MFAVTPPERSTPLSALISRVAIPAVSAAPSADATPVMTAPEVVDREPAEK